MSRRYLRVKLEAAMARVELLEAAISEHHAQKADDRCVEDDDRLYAAAGLPPCDRRVGDKDAMLANCKRFIENRCQGGGWKSYAELEAEIERLRSYLDQTADGVLLIDCEKLYCPKCGGVVREAYDVCYCDECPNPDDGRAESQPPLPLSYGLCLSKPKEKSA